MARVTNQQLADLIGVVDDRVVTVGNQVAGNTKAIGQLERSVRAANGRQREDHDLLLSVKGVQDNCPARKGNPGNPAKATAAIKENWPILTAVAGIATVLGACLKQALEIIDAMMK